MNRHKMDIKQRHMMTEHMLNAVLTQTLLFNSRNDMDNNWPPTTNILELK